MDACLCDPEQRTAFEADMSDAGVRWHMHVYGGVIPGLAYAGLPPNTPARASNGR